MTARDRLEGWCGKAVLVGVDHQLKAVGDPELVIDRRQVVAYRDLADEQTAGDLLVPESLANADDDLTLPLTKRHQPDGFRVGPYRARHA